MKTVGLVVLKGGLLNSQCYASFTWRSSEQKLADKQHFPSESVANYGDHLVEIRMRKWYCSVSPASFQQQRNKQTMHYINIYQSLESD